MGDFAKRIAYSVSHHVNTVYGSVPTSPLSPKPWRLNWHKHASGRADSWQLKIEASEGETWCSARVAQYVNTACKWRLRNHYVNVVYISLVLDYVIVDLGPWVCSKIPFVNRYQSHFVSFREFTPLGKLWTWGKPHLFCHHLFALFWFVPNVCWSCFFFHYMCLHMLRSFKGSWHSSGLHNFYETLDIKGPELTWFI